jgi:eukaryotic-like serine/threonine-protein kinase
LTHRFTEERWRTILELSEQVAVLPVHERSAYLIGAGVDSEVSVEVLELAAQFQDETSQTPAPAARLGTSIGRFLITGVLGSGGMGDVYSARDTELDRPVALKFLRPEALGYDPAYQRFIREAQTASSLNHPNIVTIYEIVRTGSTIAIVMELVEGVSLRTLIGDGRNSMSRIFEIGEQIASALTAAHGGGIVHRDIKPENVLLQADGRLKVLDFGLARRISNVAGASSLYPAGTLRYLSPEQARGDAAGSASDVFSLGLVLHELATGRHPFSAGSPFDTVHAILHGEPERLSPGDRIPRPFAELVESMLSKNASDRPPANEVARRLGEMRRGLAVEPRKAKPLYRRALVWAALAIVLVGAPVAWMKLRPVATPDFRNLRIQPLTSQPGWEADPTFSPDGESVAFTWNDRPENPQIYVKRLDKGEAIKLTASDTGEIAALAWSPDGRRIAFKRKPPGQEGAIHAVSVAGGAEVAILNLANANETSTVDWSPDGEKLIFSDQPPGSTQLAIYSFNLQTGEKTKLTTPPAGIWGDWSPTFSPDGKTIAFKRVTDYWLDEIYLVPAAGGAARQMTSIKAGIWGHAWTANGDSLIVSCQRGSTILGIWRFPLADPSRPERIQQGAGDLITPATARKGNRIAWVSRVWDTNIYRAPVSGSEPPVKLIASTQRDQNPAVAPDGRIAFVSDRSGSREIWMAAADGGSQTKVTDFGGPQIDNLMWSPDGRRLAFNSRLRGQAGVFTMECPPEARPCGEPQMFISGASAPAWSADGTAIFYSSNRAGSQQIWRHPLDGGPDTVVTRSGANFLRQSRDGKWLYLSKTPNEKIYRTASRSPATAMATPIEPVIDASIRALPFGWDIAPTEVLFFEMLTKQQRWAIRAVSIASGRVRFVSEWGESYAGADGMVLSVSRDGKWVYYPRLDSAGANIMVAESAR